ncbi:hypothetical protein [Tenacibaculum sp. SG-28]|uniref:hypothetical protein n=1 Tax=Tenacibaculum sp. SG-28 TaxID=754426 RepID=UPI000CF57BC8|nr:hypothetical protein [Tenacibaculum sp. SG-28]PQJ23034.1 hypothetical protein BSU00_01850 [Tenacibaculum sp. SG-28]
MVLRLRLLCFFFCGVLQAQINVHPVVKSGIDSAIVRNKILKNKKLDTDIDKLKKESVANLYLPKVELEAAYGYMQGVINLDLPTEVIPLPPPLNPITLFDGFGSFDFNSQFYNASLMAKSVIFSGFQIPNSVRALEKK